MRRYRVQKPCAAATWCWRVEDPAVPLLRIAAATPALVAQADDEWSRTRLRGDIHNSWAWTEILKRTRDTFVMVDADGAAAGAFASTHSTPILLSGKPYYRLDFLEVAPRYRGGEVGAVALGIVGYRARELGASGIVLAAFNVPGLVTFYESLGAKRGAPRGWNVPPRVLPLHFDEDALDRLEAIAHAYRDDQRTEGARPSGREASDPGVALGPDDGARVE